MPIIELTLYDALKRDYTQMIAYILQFFSFKVSLIEIRMIHIYGVYRAWILRIKPIYQ